MRALRGLRSGARRRFVIVAFLVAAIVLPSAPLHAGPPGDLNTFCGTAADLTQLVLGEGSVPEQNAPPGKIRKFKKRLLKLLDRAEQTAPAEIANQVSFASELTVVDSRSASEFPDILQILEPMQAIKRFVADNCGFQTVKVAAREYEFSGIPNALERETVVFDLTNEGAEVHEMAFGRIKGDRSLDALLELSERERSRLNQIEELGAGALAAPGSSDVALVRFSKPGRYAIACFVPVGTTRVDADTDGLPHTSEGMFVEFVVEAR